jgi:cytidylate kinase
VVKSGSTYARRHAPLTQARPVIPTIHHRKYPKLLHRRGDLVYNPSLLAVHPERCDDRLPGGYALTNIAFAGLTAAGKTTHAKLLADYLGYKYVSATELFLKVLNVPDHQDNLWFRRFDELESMRQGYAADIEVERRLQEMAASSDALVLDTWAMAWISRSPVIGLWIESDVPSRTRKCFVSENDHHHTLQMCAELIDRKDASTRKNFMERHGFDLFADRWKYNIIMTNSHLINEPTRQAADAGIDTFAPAVHAAVECVLDGAHARRRGLLKQFPREITHIGDRVA